MQHGTHIIRRTIAPGIAALLLAGCAAVDGAYPTLEIRDVERSGTFIPTAATPAPIPASPQTLTTLSQLRDAASAAHADFLAAAPRATRLVERARDAAIASNAWGDAQVALSNLESLRSRTAVTLGSADLLYSDAAVEGVVAPPIEQTRAAIADLVADEDTTLAALRGQLRQ